MKATPKVLIWRKGIVFVVNCFKLYFNAYNVSNESYSRINDRFIRKPHAIGIKLISAFHEYAFIFDEILDPSWRDICTDYEWDDTERNVCKDDAIDESQKETIGNISFWLQGIFKFIIGIIGVISNLAAIPTLCHQSMKSIFNKLLISLLVLHTIYLLAVIFTQMMWPDWENHPKDWFIVLFIFVLKPLQPLMLYSTTFITILLARQRYLAIRHPIEYRNSTIAVNPCIYATKSLVFVLIASGLFALPIFFETSLGYTVVGAMEDINTTHFQYVLKDQPNLEIHPLRYNNHYVRVVVSKHCSVDCHLG